MIWIVADTLRADRLGCYGYFRDTSPTMDRLAREGVLFEDFYCSAISTGAAFSCLFSGMPAIRHGFYATPAGAPNIMNFDDALPTLPEVIQSNSDYTTVAVDNLINFGGHMKQTVRGFEFTINVTRHGGFPQPEYTAGEANARFLPWLRAHSREEFFAFVHFWDSHHNPYRAPGYRDRFKQRHGSLEGLPVQPAPAGYQYVPGWGRVGEIVWGISIEHLVRGVDGGAGGTLRADDSAQEITQDLYDCSIAYLDNQIGEIVHALADEGILDDTAIVVTADHGEGLGIHGSWGHGLLYDDTIHIPLILWRPGLLPEGRRVSGFAQHADVAPMLLELAGITGDGKPLRSGIGTRGMVNVEMEGRSLLPGIRDQAQGPEFIVTEVRRGPSDPGYRSVRTRSWKLIESLAGEKELYNLDADPLEQINLTDAESSRAGDMSKVLHDWIAQHLKGGRPDPMRVWPLPTPACVKKPEHPKGA